MRVGVPTETKADEYRVALTPAGVRELVTRGHQVLVQIGAGEGSGFADADFAREGALIARAAADVFEWSELVVKVKEPQPPEVAMLRPGQLLFCFLHLAPAPELTAALCATRATCIAYETVEDARGRLPLLAPMSEVAGRIAAQAGAYMLEKPLGGRGVLMGGVPGVAPAEVMVIGGGMVGMNAAFIAIGMEARVSIYDSSVERLRELDIALAGRAATSYATSLDIEQRLPHADLVIGAVLVRGSRAPHVIGRSQLSLMKPGAVVVDVSIDQGGCFETSRPTTHSAPTFQEGGVTHYCVTNMPGAVPVTSTRALTNATLPYVARLADIGVRALCAEDPGFAVGVNVAGGRVTSAPVGLATGRPVRRPRRGAGRRGGR
jgi:alanine dehydrogenase